MNDFPIPALPPLHGESEVNPLQLDQHCHTSKLGPEIHIQIFSSLNLKDRKNVRLVNKLWNSYCSSPSISEKEKIVFKKGCKLSHISEILQRANENRIMNLEFHQFCYPNHIEESIIIWQKCGRKIANHFKENDFIWQKCGGKIVDISFFQCDINKQTFKSIFLYANNLKTFSIKFDYLSDTYKEFIKVLNFFEKRKIEHTQLHTFNLILTDGQIHSYIKQKILIVFPYLKEFHFEDCFISFEGITDTKLVPISIEDFSSFNSFHQFLEGQAEVNSSFKLLSVQFPWIPVDFSASPFTEDEIFQFFRVHKNLVSIILSIGQQFKPTNQVVKSLVFLILQNCPSIKEFSFTQDSKSTQTINFNDEEISEFLVLVSKIHHLELACMFSIKLLPTLKPLEFSAKVMSLSCSSKLNEELVIYILERGPNIEHLRLYGASDHVLQKVFKNLPNLKTLILDYPKEKSYNNTLWGFTGQGKQSVDGVSINVLEKLEYLEITENFQFSSIEGIENKIGWLSHLKYLKLTHCKSHDDILDMILELPKLEILRVPRLKAKKLSKILGIIKDLKSLKFLEVASLKLMPLHPIFMAYADLKYISDGKNVFWFNPFSGEMCDMPAVDFRLYDRISPFGWS